jgi:regulator of sigma E protease
VVSVFWEEKVMVWFFLHVVVPLVVIGVLVIVHELGHFVVAKLCGVGIVKFAIGFGPGLLRFQRRETTYQIGAIPFGGFVRMVGDMPDMLTGEQSTDNAVRDGNEGVSEGEFLSPELAAAVADRKRWFIEKNFWQRSAVVIAGPAFNYLLAIVVVTLAVYAYGNVDLSEAPQIGGVVTGSPANKAGIKAGDSVVSIDNKPIASWTELAQTVHDGTGAPIDIQIQRDGQRLLLNIQPQRKELRDYTGEKKSAYLIGIEPTTLHTKSSFVGACEYGLVWTLDKTALTYIGLWGMLTGKISPKDLAGPLFIIDAAGEQAREGFDSLLYFTALLSVSLAVLNLLPIPILDGGHLLFFVIEAILGPLSVRKKEVAQQVGMLLLIFLMVFAIHNDIFRDTDSMKGGPTWEDPSADKTASGDTVAKPAGPESGTSPESPRPAN